MKALTNFAKNLIAKIDAALDYFWVGIVLYRIEHAKFPSCTGSGLLMFRTITSMSSSRFRPKNWKSCATRQSVTRFKLN
jgi:hypothetical protein